jgi:hypothetical protein
MPNIRWLTRAFVSRWKIPAMPFNWRRCYAQG